MRVAIIGGGLQGVEACYLARKMDWKITLVDKKKLAPATGLSDVFFQIDVIAEPEKLAKIMQSVELVIPALENYNALTVLQKVAEEEKIPLALDLDAYEISSSKSKSNQLFKQINVPIPELWPGCKFPVVVKPVAASGSKGVRKINTEGELKLLINQRGFNKEEWVIQELINGPSYSLEVIGWQGECSIIQVTELDMDCHYDCKRVIAPTALPQKYREDFEVIAKKIAQSINLSGVMDVEVIFHNGKLKVLEIDARLPSQTPTAVFKSTGINILELLAQTYLNKKLPQVNYTSEYGVIYEHIKVSNSILEVLGENVLTNAGPLQHLHDFFGADEAITNYQESKKEWVATLIITDDHKKVWHKRTRVIDNLLDKFGLSVCIETTPEERMKDVRM